MSENPKVQSFTKFEKTEGKRFRWMAVTALLLAIGAILHFVVPGVGGITPNFMIAMYCIAINLVKPTLLQSAGIGLVAGAANMPTSKSAFPLASLFSELAGAVCCALIVHLSLTMMVGKYNLKPAISALLSTLVSGFVFVTILKVVLSLPMAVYLYGMLPVVVAVAAINTVVTQILYFPAERLFMAKEKGQ